MLRGPAPGGFSRESEEAPGGLFPPDTPGVSGGAEWPTDRLGPGATLTMPWPRGLHGFTSGAPQLT